MTIQLLDPKKQLYQKTGGGPVIGISGGGGGIISVYGVLSHKIKHNLFLLFIVSDIIYYLKSWSISSSMSWDQPNLWHSYMCVSVTKFDLESIKSQILSF